MTARRADATAAVRTLRVRLQSVAWLTLVWVLLWGTFTPLSVVGGVLVAVLVTAVFRVPPASDRLPVRPLRLLGLAAYLLYDVLASGVSVSWQVLRHGSDARGAIVAVPLLTRSDRVVTVIANAVSITPGNMVLQIDYDHDLWYVYVLGPRDRAGVEQARHRALDTQRRVLAALGSPGELAESDRRTGRAGR